MAELALPQNFAGADPELEVVRIPDMDTFADGAQGEFYTMTGRALWRVRFVSLTGFATGNVGSATLTLQGLIPASVGSPWVAIGPLVASSNVNINAGEDYHVTWSSDVADNYSNFNSDFGRTVVLGLPLVFLPEQTIMSFHITGVGGFNGVIRVLGGQMEVEMFRLTGQALQAGPLADVYLLPQTI